MCRSRKPYRKNYVVIATPPFNFLSPSLKNFLHGLSGPPGTWLSTAAGTGLQSITLPEQILFADEYLVDFLCTADSSQERGEPRHCCESPPFLLV